MSLISRIKKSLTSKKASPSVHEGIANYNPAGLMNGQWLGEYSGSNNGRIAIDLDDLGNRYQGTVCLYEFSPNLPSSMAVINSSDKANVQKLKIEPLWVIHPDTGNAIEWNDELATRFPDVEMPTTADATVEVKGDTLHVSWQTDIGTNGIATLPRSKAGAASELKPLEEVKSWAEFKKFAHDLDHRRFIFRGQRHPNRLRTSYHRLGRADLRRYNYEDIPQLHRVLSSKLNSMMLIDLPDHRGAFLNLMQHHGYPTPLLDWTHSPYVAAYFAYSGLRNSDAIASEESVRIFIFDRQEWMKLPQNSHMISHQPHFSLMEFISMGNDRTVPQQSICSSTNVDDIESYIRQIENTHGTEYLRVVDLPCSERPRVMQELSSMGVTAGSLFPGLDGMCAELKERNFRS